MNSGFLRLLDHFQHWGAPQPSVGCRDWAFPTNCATGWISCHGLLKATPGDSCRALRTRCGFPRQGECQFYLAFTKGSYQQLFTGANTQWQTIPGSIQPLSHIFQGSQAWQVVFTLVSINTAAAAANHTHYCKALGNSIWRGLHGDPGAGDWQNSAHRHCESNPPMMGITNQLQCPGKKALGVTHSKFHPSHR